MSRFDRYVLTQLMALFRFFSLVLVSIYWINSTVNVFGQLLSDGQSSGAVLTYTLLSLPLVFAIVMPMAAFGATAYVTNRLSSESELVVVQATGLSPLRIARPFLVFGAIVAALCATMLNLVVPQAERVAAVQKEQLARNITAQFQTPGQFLHPTPGVTFYIASVTPKGVLRGAFISDRRTPGQQTTIMSRQAYLLAQENGPRMVMVDGTAQTLTLADRRLAVTRFDDFTYDIGQLIAAARPPKPSVKQLSTADLLRADPAQMKALQATPAQFMWEANNRIAQPLLSLVAVGIGFATLLLGAFSRFGIWRQILAGIVLLVAVKLLDNLLSGYTRNHLGAWPLVYLPFLAGSVTSAAMLVWTALPRRRPPRVVEAA